ncbi:MAG TPA: nucleoside/nucleotide kinase family protein [Candidatus Dormibacteraeota bacterium]|nr:nucleoside/nucleotide kinase family protein [Candidatus Dormibacteraeota bacterium]
MRPSGVTDLESLVDRARALAGRGGRRLLGITGPPGSGKSTLAERMVAALGDTARLVDMDGFHLAQEELRRLGREERKGAPDTFDAHGYLELLARLRARPAHTVYVPRFCRRLEEPIAAAVAVEPHVPLVVTEGNYLLVPEEPWRGLRALLDEVWYCELDDDIRRRRLYARHLAYGKTVEQARRWAYERDEANARLVARTRSSADLVVRMS